MYNVYVMHRTQIYLSEEDYRKLIHLSRTRGQPMADLVRVAVRRFLTAETESGMLDALNATFGAWDRRGNSADMVRKMRREWDRREARFDPPD